MKIVLDTDVVVAGLRSPRGGSAALFNLARLGLVRPVVTVALVLEYEAVCSRPAHLAAAELDETDLAVVLDTLIARSDHAPVHFRYRPLVRDPDDELVVEAAIAGSAAVIATFNARDFRGIPAQFGIRCLPPGQILQEVLR